MPRRSIHRRRRAQGGCLSFAIGVLAVAALVLAVAIVVNHRARPAGAPVVIPDDGKGGYVDANNLPAEDHQMVLTAGDVVQGDGSIQVLTPSPTPTLEPTPTPEPTFNPDEPFALVRPEPTDEGYLPVFSKANTDKKQIAITLDECSGATITMQFVRAALENNARLTLFPTGENVMKSGMDEVLRTCYYTYGFEIENRCYSTLAKLYSLNDTLMASEIWKQDISVSFVLGGSYQPHFLRTYGRAGETDLRTHRYLAQEGYLGFAGWTYNGSLMEEGRIGNNLAPGNIYYFKTTEEDLRRMNLLITEAREQEFEMVTLNELFGYEKNACKSSANVLAETMPELQDHDIPYYFMKTGDCTWAANLMQRRLTQLGYLPEGSADGVYGSGTAAALSAFQAKMGIAATGAADVETQRLLYAEDAPRSED